MAPTPTMRSRSRRRTRPRRCRSCRPARCRARRKSGDRLVDAAGAASSQAPIASRRPIASRTRSRNVWSAPAVMAVPSARPSAPSGAAAPSSSTARRQLLQKLHLRRLVEHAEAGGDVRFEGKLVQELGAEGVDGLHLEAARRLQRAGKKPPRPGPLRSGNECRVADRSRMAASRAASSSVVQCASVSNTRFAMFAAAALVKVMQRIFSGSTPASSRLMTRCASTWVLPDPALAATHAETAGSDTAACTRRTSRGMTFGDLMGSRSHPRDRRSPTIP